MATKTRPKVTPRPAPPALRNLGTLTPSALHPGRNITVADAIVEQVRAGVDPQNAAGMAGVLPQELHAWMREGAVIYNRWAAGADWDRDFTPEQQDCCLFADQVNRARSAHIGTLSRLADQAALGLLPAKTTTVTKRVADATSGELVVTEETERVETLAPDLDMIRWKLTKLEPAVYGAKATVAVSLVDMTDTDATVDLVERRMREVAAALSARAIEATASEMPQQPKE